MTTINMSIGIFRTAIPEFKALQEFEWIGYPELQADMVQVLLECHPNLDRLGLMCDDFTAEQYSTCTDDPLQRMAL